MRTSTRAAGNIVDVVDTFYTKRHMSPSLYKAEAAVSILNLGKLE